MFLSKIHIEIVLLFAGICCCVKCTYECVMCVQYVNIYAHIFDLLISFIFIFVFIFALSSSSRYLYIHLFYLSTLCARTTSMCVVCRICLLFLIIYMLANAVVYSINSIYIIFSCDIMLYICWIFVVVINVIED